MTPDDDGGGTQLRDDAAVRRTAGRATRRLVLLLAILGTIGCDRVTKHLASTTLAEGPDRSYLGDTIRLEYVRNPGGFLSLGATLPPAVRAAVFTVATGTMLVLVTVAALRRGLSGWPALGLALFVSGGLSNWADRVTHGSVVDFLNVGIGSLRTGVFNVADVAIMVGAGLFAVTQLRGGSTAATPPPAGDGVGHPC
ncbi:MAG: signal peptidase II [Vicinamibacterales bacterium]